MQGGGGGIAAAAAAEEQINKLKCPRCGSLNTKFCYYNNYNLSQPRHFCKNCRRYWTKGGSLRNIPIGGATRKNTNRSSSSSSSSTTPTPTVSDGNQNIPKPKPPGTAHPQQLQSFFEWLGDWPDLSSINTTIPAPSNSLN